MRHRRGTALARQRAGLERPPFERSRWRRLSVKVDRIEPFAEGREEAAGSDRRQLLRVADQDRLPLRLVDELEQRRERARLGHAGLVDDEHAAARQAALIPGVEEEAVQSAAPDPGGGGELVGGAAARRGTEHRHAASRDRRRRGLGARSSCPHRRRRRRRRPGRGRDAASWTSIRCSPLRARRRLHQRAGEQPPVRASARSMSRPARRARARHVRPRAARAS